MRLLRDPRCLLLAMAASLFIACLVGRRSDDFACTTSDDCAADRGCFQGYCVAPECPAGCICQNLLPDRSGYASCTIDCTGTKCRAQPVVCPAGIACTVQCGNNDDCSRVDCSKATGCTVVCSGVGACGGAVTCGSGPCSVSCTGNNSCAGGVACGSSCRCNVTCGGNNSCATPATCPGALCDTGLGCTPLAGGACNTCP
jgi:hypothetical protein